MTRLLRTTLVLLALSSSVAISAPEWNPREGFSHVAEKAVPAVVFIKVEKTITAPGAGRGGPLNDPHELFEDEFLRRFFGTPPQRQAPRQYRQQGQGSGFIISRDGYILTNSHVIGDADKVTVRLKDGREFEAEESWSDPKSEVAIIKIDAEDLPALELGSSKELKTGEWVIAIGNPFGLSETLTAGVVSAKGRNNIGIADYEDFIQTDAAINPGNSGGPLLNIDGKVIGINTAIYSRSGGYMGIGFAIPIDMAVNIKDRLLKDGKVERGFVGISMNPMPMDKDMAETFGLKDAGGVLIADIVPESAAEKAGLKIGDIITDLNGKKVIDNAAFRNNIAMMAPGTEISLNIVRNGKPKKISLKVGALPGNQQASSKPNLDEISEKTGISVQPLTEEQAKALGLDDTQGVLISGVEPGSPAEQAGLAAGQIILEINRKPTQNIDAFAKALQEKTNKHILLRVKAQNGTWFVLLRI